MSVTMWGATLTVEIDFDNGPYTAMASRTWTDVTADVRSWSVTRGRTTELAQYAPGTLSLTLANRTRLYDPTNTAGTYYGKLLPRRCVRVRLAAGGVATTTVFTGYIEGWPQEYPADGMDSVCTITAIDAFDLLSSAEMPTSAFHAQVIADSAMAFWPCQELTTGKALVDVVADYDLRRNGSVVPTVSAVGLPLGAASGMMGGTGAGHVGSSLGSTPATVEMWVSAGTDATIGPEVCLSAASTQFLGVRPRATFVQVSWCDGTNSDTSGASPGVTVNIPRDGSRGYHLAVTATSGAIKVYIDGALVSTLGTTAATYTRASYVNCQWGDTKVVGNIAAYSTVLNATQIAAHYIAGVTAHGHPTGERAGARIGRILDGVGWASADRSLSTGSTMLGPWSPDSADPLTAIRTVETTEQGLAFIDASGKVVLRDRQDIWTLTRMITAQATFGDQAGEINYTNPLRIDAQSKAYLRNRVSVSFGSSTVTAEDTTSKTAYGVEPDAVSAADMPDTGEYVARQLAAYRLRARKTPADRVPSITVDPSGNTTALEALIPLELGDRVLVNRRPTGGSGSFAQQCRVQGIRWTGDARTGYSWSAYTSPAEKSYIEGNYLRLGDADYGLIGPAHVAFPGSSGDYLSTPDAAVLDITGDLEIVARIRPTDWTPAADMEILSKWLTAGNQRSYRLILLTTGALELQHSSDGSTTKTATSTASVSGTDGAYLWVKATLDVDNGAGGWSVKFYTAANAASEPSSWTQLGSTVTTATASSVYASTANLTLGARSNGTTNPFTGSMNRVILRSGIGGTIVFDFNARGPGGAGGVTTHGQATVAELSANAATVTANGNARLHPQNTCPY